MRYITQIERSGIQKGATSVLQRLMSQRFGEIPSHLMERLEKADPEQLERWAVRVLEAHSPEEVFGE
jgi:restriction endonuclease Mrr